MENPAEKQTACKSLTRHLKDQARCYMALISQNWTRSLLKESGSLTGVERGSFCVTEKNKRQILRENRGMGVGVQNKQGGKAVGERSHAGTKTWGRDWELTGKRYASGRVEGLIVEMGWKVKRTKARAEKIYKDTNELGQCKVDRRWRHTLYLHFYDPSVKASIKASELELLLIFSHCS